MFNFFKRKDFTIINKDQLILTMTSIIELLRENGFSAQADAVTKPLEYLYADDKVNFIKHLLTVDIWGGAGAAWEVGGFPTRQLEKEFQTHFIRLVEQMRQTGIKNGKADSVANFFRKDIANNN